MRTPHIELRENKVKKKFSNSLQTVFPSSFFYFSHNRPVLLFQFSQLHEKKFESSSLFSFLSLVCECHGFFSRSEWNLSPVKCCENSDTEYNFSYAFDFLVQRNSTIFFSVLFFFLLQHLQIANFLLIL